MAENSTYQRAIDANDLAHQVGISLQDLEKECLDEHLLDFAELCDSWELVALRLRPALTLAQINAIKEDYPSTEMKRIMVLQKWKECALTCTYKVLVEAFLKCDKTQQALVICKKVKDYLITSRDDEDRGEQNMTERADQDLDEGCAAANVQIPAANEGIRQKLRELDRHFSHVQMLLINSAGLTLQRLQMCLSTLPSFTSDSPTQLLHSSSIKDFFHFLKQYCNSLCPQLLEDLIEQVGDEEAKQEMREFKIKCEAFRRETKLKDMIGNYEGPTSVPLNYKELEIKLGHGWRERTLEDLENLQCGISLRYRLLKMIREGSVIVSYLVPNSSNISIKNLTSCLQEQEVIEITLEKKCIFKARLEVMAVDLEEFISEISKVIGLEWKFLARELDFDQTDIDAIVYKDARNLREQIYQMFHLWKKREGEGATADRLLAAVKKAELHELLKGLREKRIISSPLQGSAVFASSLAAGARSPIQASDDSQPDGPVRPKPPTEPVAGPGNTPPTERDFVRQQRLKRFSSRTSDKSNSEAVDYTSVGRMKSNDSTNSPLQSPREASAMGSSTGNTPPLNSGVGDFGVGDMVQVDRPDSAPWYGVIKWIGCHRESNCLTAGIEMEHKVEGGGSGSLQGTKYFSCSEGHGLFLPVSRLKRDSRFDDKAPTDSTPTSHRGSGVTYGEASQTGSSPTTIRANLSDILITLGKVGLQEPPSKIGGGQSAQSDSETCKGFVLQIPADQAGLVIGTGGKNIREVERLTNTSIKVDRSSGLLGGGNRKVLVVGSEDNCKKAILMIVKNIERRVDEHTAGAKTISVPDSSVGRIIGKGGTTISTIKSLSGARDIKIEDRKTGLEGVLQAERLCHIHGSEEAIEKAEKFIRLAMAGEDIVARATFAAISMELLKLGVECQEEDS